MSDDIFIRYVLDNKTTIEGIPQYVGKWPKVFIDLTNNLVEYGSNKKEDAAGFYDTVDNMADMYSALRHFGQETHIEELDMNLSDAASIYMAAYNRHRMFQPYIKEDEDQSDAFKKHHAELMVLMMMAQDPSIPSNISSLYDTIQYLQEGYKDILQMATDKSFFLNYLLRYVGDIENLETIWMILNPIIYTAVSTYLPAQLNDTETDLSPLDYANKVITGTNTKTVENLIDMVHVDKIRNAIQKTGFSEDKVKKAIGFATTIMRAFGGNNAVHQSNAQPINLHDLVSMFAN